MSNSFPTREDDERDLAFLELADQVGPSEAGRRMGLTRGTACRKGSQYRNAALAIPCVCARPENRDGGMPQGWWC